MLSFLFLALPDFDLKQVIVNIVMRAAGPDDWQLVGALVLVCSIRRVEFFVVPGPPHGPFCWQDRRVAGVQARSTVDIKCINIPPRKLVATHMVSIYPPNR